MKINTLLLRRSERYKTAETTVSRNNSFHIASETSNLQPMKINSRCSSVTKNITWERRQRSAASKQWIRIILFFLKCPRCQIRKPWKETHGTPPHRERVTNKTEATIGNLKAITPHTFVLHSFLLCKYVPSQSLPVSPALPEGLNNSLCIVRVCVR